MKIRRSERLVDMTQYLLDHSHTSVSSTYSADRYQSAKSSINEDLVIIKKTFKECGAGTLEAIPGAIDGVRLIPETLYGETEQLIMDLRDYSSEQDHLLPGNYIHLPDSLGEPNLLRQVGRIITSKYLGKQIDAVMTVATKGVPVAQAVSYYLNVPSVTICRDSKIIEDSTMSVNYVSGSSERIEKMEFSKRGLKRGSEVLVVDDFVESGDTVSGMKSMIKEFEAELVGITVFVESKFNGRRITGDYTSSLYAEDMDTQTKTINVVPGNYFTEK